MNNLLAYTMIKNNTAIFNILEHEYQKGSK